MRGSEDLRRASRRRFLKGVAMLGAGAHTLLRSRDLNAAVLAARDTRQEIGESPPMRYQKLGRTGFEGSRLVFGCGAALSRGPRDALLHAALDAGVNVFDVGFRRYYRDAEQNLGPFARAKREQIFLISKAFAPLELEPGDRVAPQELKAAAAGWLESMDGSLRELGVEQLDAYYIMAANNPHVVASDEFQAAFEQARQAGKVRFLGLSTHQNAQRVLEAAMGTGAFDLAQIAITPAGWYDWTDKGIQAGSPPMTELQPFLARVRAAGIGLIGMKAGRYLAGRKFLGWGRPSAFDDYYDRRLRTANLSPFQRSYAFVLAHGLDAVNADMQTAPHLQENLIAAATSQAHFA